MKKSGSTAQLIQKTSLANNIINQNKELSKWKYANIDNFSDEDNNHF